MGLFWNDHETDEEGEDYEEMESGIGRGSWGGLFRRGPTHEEQTRRKPSTSGRRGSSRTASKTSTIQDGLVGGSSSWGFSSRSSWQGASTKKDQTVRSKKRKWQQQRRRLVRQRASFALVIAAVFAAWRWSASGGEEVTLGTAARTEPLSGWSASGNGNTSDPSGTSTSTDSRKHADFESLFAHSNTEDEAVERPLRSKGNALAKSARDDSKTEGDIIPTNLGGDPKLHAMNSVVMSPQFASEKDKIREAIHFEYWVGAASVTVEVGGGTNREEAVRACRIPRVCRLNNGTYLLPAFFKSQKERLATCGIDNALFVLPRDGNLPSKHAGFHLDSSTYRLDLIDGPPVQGSYHPLIILDLIPHLFALESISREKETKTSCTCFTGLSKCAVGCSTQNVYPLVTVDADVWEHRDADNWVGHVIAEMKEPPGSFSFIKDGTFSPLYLGDAGAACFNSLITTPAKYYDVPPGSLNTDYSFFGEKGVVAKRWGKPRRKVKSCQVHVTILQHDGDRSLIGMFALRDKVTTHFQSEETEVHVKFKIGHMKGMTYKDQVRTMMETDVLVAPHCSDLTNIIYMPRTGAMIEIYPFSYHPSVFRWHSAILGLAYDGIMAEPDSPAFKSCIATMHGHSEDVDHLLAAWDNAARNFKKEDDKASLRLELSKSTPLRHAGSCAKKQSLKFDSAHAAKLIIERVRDQCQMKATGDGFLG